MITVNWYALNSTYNDTIMKPIWPDHCNWQLSTVSSNLSCDPSGVHSHTDIKYPVIWSMLNNTNVLILWSFQHPITQNVCIQIFRELFAQLCRPLQDMDNVQNAVNPLCWNRALYPDVNDICSTGNPLSGILTHCIQIYRASIVQQIYPDTVSSSLQQEFITQVVYIHLILVLRCKQPSL